MFADRTSWDLTPNEFSKRRQILEKQGVRILDLTESNPTRVGIRYPAGLLAPLADASALTYDPHPRGWFPAREAVASLFAAKGVPLSPDQIILTASTSEAYSHLFRLLANPGDEILMPRPSYPLFDYLADLNDVRAVSYHLRLDESALTPLTRAVVAVHPNNPTGSCVSSSELARISALCRQRDLALIADEVFAEYRFSPSDAPATLLGAEAPLVFALGGLSKFLGLPQMKLAWIACAGSPERVEQALARLEVIADTYLSANMPVQRAFPGWLKFAPDIQGQIRSRLEENLRFLTKTAEEGSCRLLPAQGGWSAVVRVPDLPDEESMILDLLEQDGVVVYPGYFFDFSDPGFLVLSLLPSPELFREGVRRLLKRVK